ncbi:MAG: CBS domain-containing protein [Salibacteraceae bacterium]|jgi:CBS domain-containing protein
MTDRVHIVLKNNRVKDAARIMSKNDVHHLVVMEDGNVVGMLSAMDIVKVYREE